MKNLVSILIVASIVTFLSCNTKNKSAEIATYKYKEQPVETNKELQRKIGDWLKNGIECYGLVVAVNSNNIPERGKPVKAKVLRIADNEIKMEAMEDVNIAPSVDCPPIGITTGEIWLEKEGELFKSKEDAVAYLKAKGLYMSE